MTKLTINIGTSANDRTGDPLRTAFDKVNQNFTELYDRAAADATDRIVSGDSELVITHDQYGGAVSFPAHSNGKVGIQSTEIAAFPADPENPNPIPLVLSSYNGEVWISPNAQGPRPIWEFKQNGTINVPVPEGGVFTLTLSSANFIPRDGKSTLTLSGAPWALQGQILRNADGTAELQLDQIFPQVNNPGYESTDTFTFDDQVHQLFGFNLEISLADVVHPGGAGWTANLEANQLPAYPKSMTSNGALSLHGDGSVLVSTGTGIHEEQFKFIARNLLIPGNGDIKRWTGSEYVSVLGSGTTDSLVNGDYTVSLAADGKLTMPETWRVGSPNGNTFISNDGFANNNDLWMFGRDAVFISNGVDAGYRQWMFSGNDIQLPDDGDITRWNGSEMVSVLGGGISITDFGEGFSLTAANKIVTNKLYSTNLTQSTQHYRLELDTNGVVHLPDQSIINGATLKSVPGNYAGITSGPTGHDEDSWMWVDDSGATIATKFSTDAYSWHFDNTGKLTLPASGTINNIPGSPVGLSYTFTQDAYGSHDVNAPFIAIYQGTAHSSEIQAGWVIHTATGGQTWTIDNVVHNGNNYELHFSSDDSITHTQLDAFPLTIESNGYTGSDNIPVVSITPDGTTTWSFDATGKLTIPTGGQILGDDITIKGTSSASIKTTNALNPLAPHTWGFGATGILSFPDGHLAIAGSTIRRRHEDITTDGVTTTVDAVGSSLTLTDTSIAMEGYADPDGVSNKVYGRVVAGQGSAIMEHIVQDVGGETGSRITVGGGIVMYAGDGVVDSSWQFDMGGDTTVPGNVTFANNKTINVINDIGALEDVYLEFTTQLNEAFYSLIAEGAGWPWGITLPLTYNSYDEFLALSPDTIPGEGVQINVTTLARNVQLSYQDWQAALASTEITVQAGPSNWTFTADKSLRLPNSAIIRQSTHEDVAAAYTAYTTAIANWEYARLSDYMATVTAGLATLEGHPFAGWSDVSGTTAQAYFDIVTEAWAIQQAPSSPPQQLIFVPAISSALYQQLRTSLIQVLTTYTTWERLSRSVDIDAGAETVSILGNHKIQVPGIVQTTPEEDIVIRARYAGVSSPPSPGGATYINKDFTFGTNGTLTFPDNTVQTTAFQTVSAPSHSYGVTGDTLGMIAFDGNYIYYCKQNYVDNSTNIWVRVAWTGTTW